MPGVSFFTDMSIVIVVAAIVGLVFSRFKLPLTVGYILAGVIVGPKVGTALISNEANIRMLSDLGVMLLMFSIGLGFSFREVRKKGNTVVFPAIWDVCFMVLGGFLLGKALGWSDLEGLLLGMILCDSSTSIAAKTVEELGWIRERFAQNTFAIALIEDVLAILLIAVLNGVAGGSAGADAGILNTVKAVGSQMGTLVLFLIGTIVAGLLFVPRLMTFTFKRLGEEMALLLALALCFGISCFAQDGLNLSLVLGAFLAGAIIAESSVRNEIEKLVKPVTNLFAAVFFVSVGLLVDLVVLWENGWTILLITFGMIAFKFLNCSVASLLVGETPRNAFKVGISMGQVAEFAFLIAAIGIAHNLSERPLYQIAVGVALLCTATNPYLLRYSDKLYALSAKTCGPRIRDLVHWVRRWNASLRSNREGGESMATHIRGHMLLLGVDLAFLAIIFMAVHIASRLEVIKDFLYRVDHFWEPFGLQIPWGGILCALGALLASIPAIWVAHHTWGEIAKHIAYDAFNDVTGARFTRLRNFVRTILRLIGLMGLIIYTAVLCNGFVQNLWVIGILLPISAAITIARSKRIRRGYKASQETLIRAFDVNALPPEEPKTDEALVAAHTDTMVIPLRAEVDGKSLVEINLRNTTGATVIMIKRKGNPIFSVGPETRLFAGDSLVLVGSDAELAQAAKVLLATVRN